MQQFTPVSRLRGSKRPGGPILWLGVKDGPRCFNRQRKGTAEHPMDASIEKAYKAVRPASQRAWTAASEGRALAAGHPCRYCGDPAEAMDHVWPQGRGGDDHPNNLVPACKRCNSRKGQRSLLGALCPSCGHERHPADVTTATGHAFYCMPMWRDVVEAMGSPSRTYVTMRRPCLDCDTPTPRTRCPRCTQARDHARGTRQQRGYDAQHQAARAELAMTLPAPCGYCGVVITRGERWVAAHVVDGDPSFGWLLAHYACNERAKTRVGGISKSQNG
jgi:hypothetical protein